MASSQSDDLPDAIRIEDGLGHDVLSMTEEYARQMLEWLDLEEAAGEFTEGLANFRELLRVQVARYDA